MRIKTCCAARAMLATSLWFGAAPGQAQGAPTAADVTDSLRDFDRALKIAVGGTVDAENRSRTVFLLIDATPALKQSGFVAKLRHTIRECGSTLATARIGVAVVGQSKPVLLAPTTNHGQVVQTVATLLAAPKNEIRNVYANVRRLAAAMSGKGRRDIVLVTLDNGDAEDAIETTAAQLRNNRVRFTAIVRESYLSDSYWVKRRRYWHDTRKIKLPKDCDLLGGDSAFIDVPWGWVFQQTVVNEVVPSGFGVFGVTRLAAASGGRVFLYSSAAASKHKCAVYGACLFCTGDHIPDGEAYANLKLRELAPLAVSRKNAYRAVGTNPYLRAVVTAWRSASKAGVIQTSPTVQVGGTTVRPDRNRGGAYLGFFDSLSFDRHARKADEAAKACTRIITRLEKEMADAARRGVDRAPGAARHKAIAALTRVYLYVARTNLVSFADWCRIDAPELVSPLIDPVPPEISPFAKEPEFKRITFYNMCLCHGVPPFFGVRLPGGPALHRELLALDRVATEFMSEYRDTPYAVAMHRAGIARFSLVSGKPPPRARPGSKVKKGPVTGGNGRGRPVRNPGATTGGAASGPTTGRRP